jgi:hypothetical protein
MQTSQTFIRLEVLTAVTMKSTIFGLWRRVVWQEFAEFSEKRTACKQIFSCLSPVGCLLSFLFDRNNGSRMSLRNMGGLPDHTPSHYTRTSMVSMGFEPQPFTNGEATRYRAIILYSIVQVCRLRVWVSWALHIHWLCWCIMIRYTVDFGIRAGG